MKSGMALRLAISLLSLWVTVARAKVTEGPWLTNGAPLPKNGLRVTTLGSGTPDVRKDQVSSGFLLELGNGDKIHLGLRNWRISEPIGNRHTCRAAHKGDQVTRHHHDSHTSHAVLLCVIPIPTISLPHNMMTYCQSQQLTVTCVHSTYAIDVMCETPAMQCLDIWCAFCCGACRCF